MNTILDTAMTKRFGRQFRGIYYDIRDLEFSFKLLTIFLGRAENLKCTTSSECREEINLAFDMLKNDLNVKELYTNILKSTINGKKHSKKTLLTQVKESSGCDLQVMFNVARNIILQLFKAEQIVIIFKKITNRDENGLFEIRSWADDMYEIREHLFGLFDECGATSNCSKDCKTGKCVKNFSNQKTLCVCREHYDGMSCGKGNPISLTTNIVSLMATLSQVPKMNKLIDVKFISDYYTCSMGCVPSATDTVQKIYSEGAADSLKISMYDLTIYYNTFLNIEYYINLAKRTVNYGGETRTIKAQTKLLRVTQNLPRYLSNIHHYFCSKGNVGDLGIEPLFISFVKKHQKNACSADYKERIDNLWTTLHITHVNGFVALLQALYALNRPLHQAKQQYQKQINSQHTCNKGITCQLPHSVNKFDCFDFYLLRNQSIEITCEQQYKPKSKRVSCNNLSSGCILCNCSPTGSLSAVCDQDKGQCNCKSGYHGTTCANRADRDCKWGQWSSWKLVTLMQKERYRNVAIESYGNGKQCSGNKKESKTLVIGDCSELREKGHKSGIYKTKSRNGNLFDVYCEMSKDGGGWTVFQRRNTGKLSFYRNWQAYENGFGNLDGEFWLGNRKLSEITSRGHYEMRVDLQDFLGEHGFAKYSTFSVGNANTKYILSVDGYSGNIGDSLAGHNGNSFSTYDKDNDKYGGNCAKQFTGAWWYNLCHDSNLNGKYIGHKSNDIGMRWHHWKESWSMKATSMMVRRK